MHSDMTYEVILNRMLDRVPGSIDKREGSIIYNALAPAAAELAQMYIEINWILDQSFADTQSRRYLIRRTAERGIHPEPATKAVIKGEFNIDVPIGSRFSLDALNYRAVEKIAAGIFSMECEIEGEEGNQVGTPVPIEYIEGLAYARLTEILIPGEDEEDTESLRKRYFDSLDAQAFGGNIADYREKTNGLPGVGGVKVYPVWNGGGTVKLVMIDSTFGLPSSTLIDSVQTAIDPTPNQGLGLGLAPIGHRVTVEGVRGIPISISTNITYEDGYTWENIKADAEKSINQYFNELSKAWAASNTLVVRISQIEIRLLDIDGVLDISGTSINSAKQNLILGEHDIPLLDVMEG